MKGFNIIIESVAKSLRPRIIWMQLLAKFCYITTSFYWGGGGGGGCTALLASSYSTLGEPDGFCSHRVWSSSCSLDRSSLRLSNIVEKLMMIHLQ